jgi:hypothetical protein
MVARPRRHDEGENCRKQGDDNRERKPDAVRTEEHRRPR